LVHKCGTRIKAAFAKQVDGSLPNRIGYWHDTKFKLPGLSIADTRRAIETVFRLAQLYVPVPFDRVRTSKAALLRITLGTEDDDFDEGGNTLAMAEVISLRDKEPRQIWFSPFVHWTEGPISGRGINPVPVGAHELGHTLGFGHNTKLGLMSPTISPLITTPTEQEMKVFWKEYSEWKPT
jgi:hypothetical protein